MRYQADYRQLMAELQAKLGVERKPDHSCRPHCEVCERRGREQDRAAKREWRSKRYGSAPEGVDPFRGFR